MVRLVPMTVTHNLIGANYTFGTFTLMGGWTSSKNNLCSPRLVRTMPFLEPCSEVASHPDAGCDGQRAQG
jgi:hypothetical protein